MSVRGLSFCSWSGGKDSCLALDRHYARGGAPKPRLLTMTNPDGRTGAHGLSAPVLGRQAASLGLDIEFGQTDMAGYEAALALKLAAFAASGIEFGVFGDIDLEEHRVWIERVLLSSGLRPLFPLWRVPRRDVVAEFLERGYRALIVSARKGSGAEPFLGRMLDPSCVAELEAANVDPSAEGGEFHTFVLDGPAFAYPVEVARGAVEETDTHFLLPLG